MGKLNKKTEKGAQIIEMRELMENINFNPIVFDKLPIHDTCWSLITGADSKIYIGVCGEMTGGVSAYIASYDPETKKVEYLLEVEKVLG